MKEFAQLLELLALTPSRNRKIEALKDYFGRTPDPDRGFALAILTGALTFKNVKPAVLREVSVLGLPRSADAFSGRGTRQVIVGAPAGDHALDRALGAIATGRVVLTRRP